MNKKLTAIILCMVMVCTALFACGPKETKSGILGESDLENVKIGVIEGSKSETLVQKYTEKGCEIVSLSSRLDIAAAFENGDIDCAVMDENHAKQFVAENDFCEIRGESLGEDTLAFSTLQSNKVYHIMLNKALAALKEDGTIDKIVEGYLRDSEYAYEFADKLDNSNGSFVISIDPSMYPYVFPVDNEHDEPRGIELALIDAICKYLGCDYTLLTVTTASLSSSLRTGFADFSVGSYDLGNDIGETILETDPILTYNHVIVVKK